MEQDTLERPAVADQPETAMTTLPHAAQQPTEPAALEPAAGVAEVLQQDPPPFADAIAQGDVEYLSITMESLGTTDPADADVIWTAASAVADAYGWTTAEAIARLSAIDWQI